MSKTYCAPQAAITRLTVTNITTASTEAEWGDQWDEALQDEDNA